MKQKFSVDDPVIHPRHGAGRISALEHEELVEGFEHYYVIDIAEKGLTVRVPVRTASKIGIRPAISRAKIRQVMETLRAAPKRLPKDFKKRQARVKDRMKTGRATAIAETIRDLAWHERRKHLSKTDADVMRRAREMLASEISVVTGNGLIEVNERIDKAISTALTQVTAS